VWLFLLVVVFFRAQATYWVGRWLRHGLSSPPDAAASERPTSPSRRARLAARFSGPGWERARAFLDRWGFVGVPLSFLTVGFQTMVNAAAGFGRMRWDLYTAAMLPGCAAWAALYSIAGFSLVAAWQASPWLFAGVVIAVIAVAGALTAVRRRRAALSSAARS
jgi:membrane protein DedA with SNARE-associated domain